MNTLKQTIIDHPLFHGMKPEHWEIIASGAAEVNFNAGQVLFQEGEPANKFYLISCGRMVLEAHEPADGTVEIQTLGRGDVLGWSWLFSPYVWHFKARALEPTKAVALDGAHLLIATERDHDFGYELMKRVAQTVIHRLQSTRRRLLTLQIDSALEG